MMANEFSITIDGNQVKELRCKNDECRKLICYEQIKIGLIVFVCPRCETISTFNMRYENAGQDFIDNLQKKFVKGGEK